MTTVLLVDDQALVRSGFRLILSVEDDLEVVGEAADGAEAVEAARELRPDVVLMDVQMPVMDGIEATRRIAAENLAPVLVLTTFDTDDYVFDALAAGASGFLLKNSDAEHLVEAVRTVAEGQALLSPQVTRRVVDRMVSAGSADSPALRSATGRPAPEQPAAVPPSAPGADLLTPRELEVLTLVGRGLSNAEIAAELFLGEATVKTHVSNVLSKLHLRDRVQAVVYVHRHAG
ncbi:response regulator transcription factor [Isoptericola halotolerans]|uniref:DNA-binding NarL/FixJ family response regulator n=1 Tax=Isoptericola halotolerans TaxID=300560 RepID=A0ABX2A8Z5_9MICO|nr:response regulator transcription factor [Isoptericola halotolerans]NOV98450.1 DNA-binding NarL/FixJ family response regulator [Isoptericola halotolerans]